MHARDPECYTVGEVPDLYNTQSIDLWLAIGIGRAAYRADIFRYVLPQMLVCWCIDENERGCAWPRLFAMGHFWRLAHPPI